MLFVRLRVNPSETILLGNQTQVSVSMEITEQSFVAILIYEGDWQIRDTT